MNTPAGTFNPDDQLRHLPGQSGKVVGSASFGKDGGPTTFDPGRPMPVNVDPEYADGFIFDPSKVTEDDTEKAFSQNPDAHSAFQHMTDAADKRAEASRMPTPAPPPQAIERTGETLVEQQPLQPLRKTPPPTNPAPAPAPSQVPDNLASQVADIMIRRQREEAMLAEPPATLEPPRPGLVESLNIDFIAGNEPQKPQYEVFFNLGDFGQAAGRYHGFIETDLMIVLLYDTRFEYGYQYLPPTRNGEPMQIECPKIDKTATISYVGLKYSLGCIDHLILIKNEPEAPEEG